VVGRRTQYIVCTCFFFQICLASSTPLFLILLSLYMSPPPHTF
jgi:hypothetical protein